MSLKEAFNRVQLAFEVGRLVLFGKETVQVKGLEGETLDFVERVEPYGFSSRPKAGAQVYLCSPGGDRGRALAVVIGDTRYQLELLEGGVALHDDNDNFVKIEGQEITVKSSKKITLDAPDVYIKAASITSSGTFANNGTNIGSDHTHPQSEGNELGGNTSTGAPQ